LAPIFASSAVLDRLTRVMVKRAALFEYATGMGREIAGS
jgi:hypothetical protein